MPSLKDLRSRINSVKSTQKITSAMKMVAASKLRRAQDAGRGGAALCRAHGARCWPTSAAASPAAERAAAAGRHRQRTRCICWSSCTADRGLAGGFNTDRARASARDIARRCEAQGKTVKIMRSAARAATSCAANSPAAIVDDRRRYRRQAADRVRRRRGDRRPGHCDADEAGEFDVCTLIYNRFQSVIARSRPHSS